MASPIKEHGGICLLLHKEDHSSTRQMYGDQENHSQRLRSFHEGTFCIQVCILGHKTNRNLELPSCLEMYKGRWQAQTFSNGKTGNNCSSVKFTICFPQTQ